MVGKKKLLLVRLDAIGDFFLWIEAAQGLREMFPSNEYEITLLGNQIWTQYAKTIDCFDDVWSLDRQKFYNNARYRFKLLKLIRRAGFNVVIQPTFSRELLYGDSVVRISGAKEKIGFESDLSNIGPWGKKISDLWYTRLIPATKEPLMELERNAEFMRGLGLKEFISKIPILPGFNYSSINTNYYVLCPGASFEHKQWPLSRFKQLAELIYQNTGWEGIICGGPGEEHLEEFLEHDKNAPLKSIVGKTSLEELVSIIAGARILIGNDTSAVHIAAAVSTPSVSILGGGHFGRFLPYPSDTNRYRPVAVFHKMDCYNCNWRCIYSRPKPFLCIENVSVDSVWNAVNKIIRMDVVNPWSKLDS